MRHTVIDNAYDELQRCLDSVLRTALSTCRLILVDDRPFCRDVFWILAPARAGITYLGLFLLYRQRELVMDVVDCHETRG